MTTKPSIDTMALDVYGFLKKGTSETLPLGKAKSKAMTGSTDIPMQYSS